MKIVPVSKYTGTYITVTIQWSDVVISVIISILFRCPQTSLHLVQHDHFTVNHHTNEIGSPFSFRSPNCWVASHLVGVAFELISPPETFAMARDVKC